MFCRVGTTEHFSNEIKDGHSYKQCSLLSEGSGLAILSGILFSLFYVDLLSSVKWKGKSTYMLLKEKGSAVSGHCGGRISFSYLRSFCCIFVNTNLYRNEKLIGIIFLKLHLPAVKFF